MFTRLWSAFARVTDAISSIADSLFALSDTFRQTNAVIRERFQLDALPEPPSLTEKPALLPGTQPPAAETPSRTDRRSRNATTR